MNYHLDKLLSRLEKNDHSVTEINCSHCQISDGEAGAIAIAILLHNNNAVTELNLASNIIGNTGARNIASLLQHNNTIVKVNLQQNKIDSDGAVKIANALCHNQIIEDLCINWKQGWYNRVIVDPAAIAFAEMLLVNQTLRTLDLGSTIITPAGVSRFASALQTNTSLRSLCLKWCNFSSEYDDSNDDRSDRESDDNSNTRNNGAQAIADILTSNRNLEVIKLRNAIICLPGITSISIALHNNHTLRELDLGHSDIQDNGLKVISEMLHINKTLTSLNVSANSISLTGAKYITYALKHNSSLLKLNVGRNKISMEGRLEIAKSLKCNHTLKELDIRGNFDSEITCGDKEAETFAEMLLVNQSLSSLSLNSNDFSSIGVTAISSALHKNYGLLNLRLVGCICIHDSEDDDEVDDEVESETNEGVDDDTDETSIAESETGEDKYEAIASMLEYNSTLTNLCLCEQAISTTSIKLIAASLKNNNALRKLDLRWNNINDDGAIVLAEALKINRSLTHLDLSCNNIRPMGVEAIALVLQCNCILTSLNLKGNRTDKQGLKEIFAALHDWNDTITDLKFSLIGATSFLKFTRQIIDEILIQNKYKCRSAPQKSQLRRRNICKWLLGNWVLKKSNKLKRKFII
jgi:Ran GTPase-activating protein (RanGAP) involved in mRNA processing and transport